MSAPAYLLEAGIYLSAAVIAVPLFKRFGLGSVLGYLLAGIVIGPYAFKLIDDPERVLNFAEFGVVLLLFLVGLETEPAQVWRLRKSLFGLGGLQVAITMAVGTVAAMALGLAWQTAVVAGMGLAMSSTAIGLASLEERKLLATRGGQASFAVLLFQDLSVIPLFMVLALLAPVAKSGFDLWAAARALLVVGAIIVASRTIVRRVLRIVAQTGLREIFIAFSLLLVIGVSIAVQSVGLSMALGTFLAGMLLADSEYRYELQLDIEPAKGLLLGLFFIAVGMSVDLPLLAREPLVIFGLALTAVLVKAVILYALARAFRLPARDARLFAVGLSQVGEFAFVIFGVAIGQDTMDRTTYNALNAIVAVSMLLTPLAFVLYDRFTRAKLDDREEDAIEEQHPVIVAGFGRFGQIVVRVLNARGYETTLIDHDPNQVELVKSFGWRCYYGDASRMDLLEQAGIATAQLIVIAIDDPVVAVKMARLINERWPQVKMVARARSRTDAYELHEIGLHPVRETFYSSLVAATQALRAMGEPAHAAWRIVRHFERHDNEMLERAHKVRGDRQAISNIADQGRRDLEALLKSERLGIARKPDKLEDGWAHQHPPDDDTTPPRKAES